MTVKELKKILRKVPRDTMIYMGDPKTLYDEHIDRVYFEYDDTDRRVYVVLHSNYDNCR